MTRSAAWFGRRLSSCYPSTSTSSFFLRRPRILLNFPSGSGEPSANQVGTRCHLALMSYFSLTVLHISPPHLPVHVIRTNYRPVPLSHNLWAGGKLHKILEGKGAFDPKGYTAAAHALLPASAREAAEKGKKGEKKKTTASGKTIPTGKPSSGSKHSSWQQQGSKQDWISLVRFLEREGLMPTVTFSFSKRKCEELADSLRSLDLNTQQEKNLVQSFSIQTVNRLSPQDQILPQVIKTVEMVKRGIAGRSCLNTQPRIFLTLTLADKLQFIMVDCCRY